MSMTKEQIQQYVMTYLETTECHVIEKSPYHVTVKLSPRADRDLTNRPYYWGFIDRTGAEPETMSFSFIFDSEQHKALTQSQTGNKDSSTDNSKEDSIMGRHFGAVRPLPVLGPGRIQQEELVFGSPRLKQIFAASRQGGRCVYLFENPGQRQRMTLISAAYEPWLGVCFKIEFWCDMKREELHFYGISLLTGRVDEGFAPRLQGITLQPRLPENVHIEPTRITLSEGKASLEACIQAKLASYNHSWAEEARERLNDELSLIDSYYSELLKEEDVERQAFHQEQYESRRGEIRWQYEPRIVVSAVNYGIFHLRSPR
ncbi:Bacterial protein YqhG [compost metagenome]